MTLGSLPSQAVCSMVASATAKSHHLSFVGVLCLLDFTKASWRKLKLNPRQPSACSAVSTQPVFVWWTNVSPMGNNLLAAFLRHLTSYLNFCSWETKNSNSLKYWRHPFFLPKMSSDLGFFPLPFLQHLTYIIIDLSQVLPDSSVDEA